MPANDSERLIEALERSPALLGGDRVERIETHISWVLLAGDFAYKLKKPVCFGFLDFSTLERREFFCREELRLNRRLAPELYLDVVAIAGTPDAPRLGGGSPIEFAVRMKRFPQEGLLSRALAAGRLTPAHIDALAAEVAAFHALIDVAPADSPFGLPDRVLEPVLENFRHVASAVSRDASRTNAVAELEMWSRSEHGRVAPIVAERKRDGFIRECHGDMHLGNMILRDDGSIAIFDGIEFNESLRWTDVAAEIAFLTMDLTDRGRLDYARRALNAYLEHTGDYGLLPVLSFYQAYRAMVRAKVAALRLGQEGLDAAERDRQAGEMAGYIRLAESYTRRGKRALILTHGLSGSGKTFGTQPLVDQLGAVRIRSDVERKRLFGLKPHEPSGSGLGTHIYSPEASRRTYDRLRDLARLVATSGRPVVVDAACLHRASRDEYRRLAGEWNVPFTLLSFEAPVDVLRERIDRRARSGTDASEATLAVLEQQLRHHEPLAADETDVIVVDTIHPDPQGFVDAVRARLQ